MHDIMVLGDFDIYYLLFQTINNDMNTLQKRVNNLVNENICPLKFNPLRQGVWYLEITSLYQNTYFTYKILQYTCFYLLIF